jgi:hypothetical protein
VPTWITGRHLASALVACRSGTTCGDLFQNYHAIDTVVNLTVMVPLLIGIFWGATIVGRELEAGTATLAWTQSVTRRQWLWTKLLTLFVFTVASSGAVAGLVTWWSGTRNSVVESRFSGLQFDLQGVSPVGYAIFASALGLAAGVLWRRSLPAMATTIAGFVGVRLVVELAARPHYMSPVTRYASLSKGGDVPQGSWTVSQDLTLHGRVITGPVGVPNGCAGSSSREAMDQCMGQHGYEMRTVFQPAGRYWTFQWIEFGIFAGLAAVLVATAIVVLRRQDA